MSSDCLAWTPDGWEPLRWRRGAWTLAGNPGLGWEPAAMPCRWPAVQQPPLWGWRRPVPLPALPMVPLPAAAGQGVVVIV
jgi:hypothetical protein